MEANVVVSKEDYDAVRKKHAEITGIDEIRLTRLIGWCVGIIALAQRNEKK